MPALAVDMVVVGAGHAGVEAALAAARMGCQVALVTLEPDAVARMSCNPAIGGLGKSQLVREIDALGGQMGLCADATSIQFRRLNTRKGAAVRSTRVQSDKAAYSQQMSATLEAQPKLNLVAGEVAALRVAGGRLQGVTLADGRRIDCPYAILTTGTFLDGLMHVGPQQQAGGRYGEAPARALSHSLRDLGLPLARLKTGTPPRLDARSLDYARMELQPGDDPAPRLSYWSVWPEGRPPLPQRPCHITHTNERTHATILANLERSAMFSGAIQSTGPRYCPSIEDKLVRFAGRARHHIFVEPEGLDTDWVYPNGISTSLPEDVQQQFVNSVAGFEQARIVRFGYAVEYDYCDPLHLQSSLGVPEITGLYLAGQINGTTGYEEAAAQGLLAGINATRHWRGDPPLQLRRDEAYIAVMVDDLVTRGVGGEPYRMFTSRAEYRLLLREDNAAARLTPLGRELGLIDDARWELHCRRQERAEALHGQLATQTSSKADATLLSEALDGASVRPGTPLAELLRRPEVGVEMLREVGMLERPDSADHEEFLCAEQAELRIKYAPYIERQHDQAERLRKLEDRRLPEEIDYANIAGLRGEICEKLRQLQPRSLAQAARIPGITPAAVALLEVHLRVHEDRVARAG